MYTRNSSRCAFGHFGSSWFMVVQIICDRSDKPKNELNSSPGITFIIVMTVAKISKRASDALQNGVRGIGRFPWDLVAFVQRGIAVELKEFLELVTHSHVMMHTVAHVADFTGERF